MKQAAPFTSPAAVDIKKARKFMPAAGGGSRGSSSSRGNIRTDSLKDHTTNSKQQELPITYLVHSSS